MIIQRLPRPHTITVLRNALGDCTNGGISGRHTSLKVVAVSADELGLRRLAAGSGDAADKLRAYLAAEIEASNGTAVIHVHREIGDYLVPAEHVLAGKWWMMGGNYAHSSDGRWRDHQEFPLPVHDRVES